MHLKSELRVSEWAPITPPLTPADDFHRDRGAVLNGHPLSFDPAAGRRDQVGSSVVLTKKLNGLARRRFGLGEFIEAFEACGHGLRRVVAVGFRLTFNLDALFFTALGVRLSRAAMYPSERCCCAKRRSSSSSISNHGRLIFIRITRH